MSGKSQAGTDFTEDDLIGVLKTLWGVYGGKRTYQGIGGNNAIDTIDHFTRTGASNERYRVTEMADEHEITCMVNVFDCSFGRLEVQPNAFIKCTAAGVPDAEALAILSMDLWHMDMFDPLHAMELPDLGGGPNGFAKVMWALLCDSPRGNGKIYNS